MERDIFKRIDERMPGFSKGQRAIAKYILSSPESAAFLTAARLSEQAGVSESTVVRFALELGYAGYPAMQAELRTMVRRRLETANTQDQGTASVGGTTALYADLRRLQELSASVDVEVLRSASSAIIHARGVCVLGFSGSELLARYLVERLGNMISGVRLHILRDEREVCQALVDTDSGTLVVLVTCSLTGQDLAWAEQFFHHTSFPVLLLGDGSVPALCRQARWVLTAPQDPDERIQSLTATVSLINGLLSSVFDHRDDKLRARLARVEDVKRMVRR